MAKMSLGRIAAYTPGDSTLPLCDERTYSVWDTSLHTLAIDIEGGKARIVAAYSGTGRLDSVAVTITEAKPHQTVTARVNRLLDGLNAPNIGAYHRAQGAICIRMPGMAYTLPSLLIGSVSTTGLMGWKVSGGMPVSSAPKAAPAPRAPKPAPVAPVQTPTPAPIAPIAAPYVEMTDARGTFVNGVLQETAPIVVEVAAPMKVPAPTAKVKSGLFVYPSRNTTHKVECDALERKKVETSWQRHVNGVPTTLAIVGPAGSGKTSLVWDVAADKGIGVFQFDCAGASTTADWFGATVLDKDGTRFAYSSFIEAIRQDGPHGDETRMVLLDELNRAESSAALNALMSILTKRTAYIPETGETIIVSTNVMFVATLNRGSAYSGTVSLDAALVERFEGWMRLDFLTEDGETALVTKRTGLPVEDARTLVKTAAQVREVANRGEIRKSVSTRMVLAAASFAVAGLSLREAAEMTWADSFDDEGASDSDRGIVLTAINSVLP